MLILMSKCKMVFCMCVHWIWSSEAQLCREFTDRQKPVFLLYSVYRPVHVICSKNVIEMCLFGPMFNILAAHRSEGELDVNL